MALGLGLVAAVFTFFNAFFFRVDAVRDPGELFAVERLRDSASRDQVPFMRPEYEALRTETRVFTDVVGVLRGLGTRVDGRPMTGTLVTGNFFQVLGANAALGRALTPADDERRAGRPVIVLSYRAWSASFASERTVVGRTVRINGLPYEIVGVMPDGFRGLRIGAPDYWAPLSLVGHLRPAYAGREDEIGIEVIGRLRAGVSSETAAAGLTVWASGHRHRSRADTASSAIQLEPRQGTLANDAAEALLVFVPLFFAFGLILAIGCANVANLLLARGLSRQREIGVRLSLGASRGRIVRQLLTENLLFALAAAACGLLISRVVLHATLYLAATTLPPEIAETRLSMPAVDWRVAMFLLAGAIVSTVFFGLAPALVATRLELVRTMRGEVTRDSRPGRTRSALIVAQVGASALLLICAAVFLRSSFAAAAADVGLRTTDTVLVELANERLRADVVAAVTADPVVAAMAASWPHPLASPRSAFARAGTTRRLPVGFKLVSPEYFEVLDIEVLRGRGFTQAERSANARVVVVSETTARETWSDRDAVGQVLQLETEARSENRSEEEAIMPTGSYTVVGVVRDVPGFQLADWPLAAVYLPTGSGQPNTALTVRVHGDLDAARAALFTRLAMVDPATTDVMTLRVLAGIDAFLLQIAFRVTVALGVLALVLTLSGLFSVLSYVVERRTKEIGVRMSLGATTRSVTGLVLSQVLRHVGFGLVAGAGLAAVLGIVLRSTPAAPHIAGSVHVFDPLAYAVSLFCIATACVLAAWVPAQRAARIDPIATLRQD